METTTQGAVAWTSDDQEWWITLNRRAGDYELCSSRWGMVASYSTAAKALAEYSAVRERKQDSAAYRYFISVGR